MTTLLEKGRLGESLAEYEIVDMHAHLMFGAVPWGEEPADPAYDATLPPPPKQPQRGFGKVWREELGGTQAAIGWALESERSVDGFQQPFQRGFLYWTDAMAPGATAEGTAYLLYNDGTWQSISVPGP